MLLILALSIYPLLFSLVVSFINYDFQVPGHAFVGLEEFRAGHLRSGRALVAVADRMLSGVSVAIEFVLGLAAGAGHGAQTFRGRGVIMSILIVPLFISPVIVGQAWTLLLQRPFGPTNYILSQLLGQEVTIGWMTESPWLYVSLIIADVWQWTPFMFVILLAGLTAIPPNLYEAAELDGVNAWQAFWAITLPHLGPMMLLALTFRLLDAITHVRHDLHHDRRRAGHADLHGILLSLHGRLHAVPSVAGDRRKLAVPDLHRARRHAAGAAAA